MKFILSATLLFLSLLPGAGVQAGDPRYERNIFLGAEAFKWAHENGKVQTVNFPNSLVKPGLQQVFDEVGIGDYLRVTYYTSSTARINSRAKALDDEIMGLEQEIVRLEKAAIYVGQDQVELVYAGGGRRT